METATISSAAPLFLQADRLFHGDFAEGVHAHFDIGQVNAGLVGLHANFHVVVDHPLDGDEDFHRRLRSDDGSPTTP
jgi:hypothetical protein